MVSVRGYFSSKQFGNGAGESGQYPNPSSRSSQTCVSQTVGCVRDDLLCPGVDHQHERSGLSSEIVMDLVAHILARSQQAR